MKNLSAEWAAAENQICIADTMDLTQGWPRSCQLVSNNVDKIVKSGKDIYSVEVFQCLNDVVDLLQNYYMG